VRLKYAFIKQLSGDKSIRRLCLTLKVHPSDYYAWQSEPKSARAKEDQRLLGLIKHSWLENGGVYGYRKIHVDLREVGESCGRHRARLMCFEGLRSQTGYRRRPGKSGGKPAVASPNLLERQFDVREPNKVWVTYIRTYEGWLYLAVVHTHQLFSRHPEVRQCEQRGQLSRVFHQSTKAYFHIPKLAFDHPKRVLNLDSCMSFAVLDLTFGFVQ
jgi:putative transposase